MDRAELEALDREALVAKATDAGIKRARILTRPELIDELLRLDPNADETQLKRSRGFFGRARDLVARVVERGLHLPDAADAIRLIGTLPPSVPRLDPQAVPTVTLAEIYAAQGHVKRAIETVQRVLEREPEHGPARALLAKLTASDYVAPEPPLPPEQEKSEWPAAMRDPDDQEEEGVAPSFDEHAATVVLAKPRLRAEDAETVALDEDAATVVLAKHAETVAVEHEPPTERWQAPAQCIAVPLPGARYVTWRVPSSRAADLVLRVVAVRPGWDGPTRDIRDVPTTHFEGELVVRDVPDDAVVRVAVGQLVGGEFRPLAQSPALEATRRRPGIVKWTLRGPVAVALDDPRSAIARAVQAAQRVAS